MKTLLLTLFLLTNVHAQEIEYGKPDDLKGITKVFVDTGTDMKNRERIIKVIEKANIPVTLVESRTEAEVLLMFAADRETYLSGMVNNPPIVEGSSSTSRPTYRKVDTGAGVVVKPLGGNKVRLLMDFSGSARMRWTAWPSEQFAKAFIKAYKKANGLK